MESMIEFFNYITDSMGNFADNSDSFWERVVIWLSIAYLEVKLTALEFAYGIAYTIIDAAGISDAILNSWQGIPSTTVAVFAYLRIPDAINLLMSASLTRFILDLLP